MIDLKRSRSITETPGSKQVTDCSAFKISGYNSPSSPSSNVDSFGLCDTIMLLTADKEQGLEYELGNEQEIEPELKKQLNFEQESFAEIADLDVIRHQATFST